MMDFEIIGAGFSDRHLHVTVKIYDTSVELGLLTKDDSRELGSLLLRAADELLEHAGVLDYADKRLGDLIKLAESD